MTLATNLELITALNAVSVNTGWISSVGSQREDRINFEFTADGETCLYRSSSGLSTPMIDLSASSDTRRKYYDNTGATWEDNIVDFMVHWIDGFRKLSSLEQIKARMENPATAGAFATTVAVNRYIAGRTMTEEEIKMMFVGSRWQWHKVSSGDWVQKTLYPMNDSTGRVQVVFDNLTVFTNRFINSLRHFQYVLEQQNDARQMEEDENEIEDAQDTLLGHSDRATTTLPFKQGKEAHRTFLGVELELEGHSRDEFKSLNTIKDHAIFKRDGSLNNGVEICSAPATLLVHEAEFKKFFDAMEANGSNLEAQGSCGMHVHIDRKKLSTLHIANLCLFLNNPDNETPIVKIAGRSSNSYCERTNHRYNDFTISTGSSGSRYRRVNLTNSATVELRLFASTTNYKDFCARLEFTQASVDYTRPGETNIPCNAIPMWSNFKEYVLSHKKFYPNLIAVMGK